jgi:hypothetical protein
MTNQLARRSSPHFTTLVEETEDSSPMEVAA